MRFCTSRLIVFVSFIALTPSAFGQNSRSELDSLYQELDSLFANESIPDDLFRLADSLLALENARISVLSVRGGYVSEVLSAGRAFGVSQYGFNPSLTYYHHSGFYGGVTGYWSNEYTPGYYLTDISAGYMRTSRNNKWNMFVDHSFYIFNDTIDDHPFRNSAQAALSHRFSFADASVDYSFLYGSSNAHRITTTANLRLRKSFKGWIESITIMPGIAGQWGNADVLYLRQPRNALTDLHRIIRTHDYPRLNLREYLRLYNMLESGREQAAALFLFNREYTPEQIGQLIDQYYDGQIESDNSFGFMNLYFSLPVIIRMGSVSLLLNYTYNLPHALPGEDYAYDPSGYFSASLTWSLSWLKK